MKIKPNWSQRRHYVGRCDCQTCSPYLEESVKAKEYSLMERCVEDGIGIGFHRAYKHNDAPTQEQLMTHIYDEVMNEISEWFIFEEHNND